MLLEKATSWSRFGTVARLRRWWRILSSPRLRIDLGCNENSNLCPPWNFLARQVLLTHIDPIVRGSFLERDLLFESFPRESRGSPVL